MDMKIRIRTNRRSPIICIFKLTGVESIHYNGRQAIFQSIMATYSYLLYNFVSMRIYHCGVQSDNLSMVRLGIPRSRPNHG
jgi:hypothetical protein